MCKGDMVDHRRFDDLARSVVTRASRRAAVPAVLGSLFGLPAMAAANDDKSGGRGMPAIARRGDAKPERIDLEGELLEQKDPKDALSRRGPAASGKKPKKQPIGLRSIWFNENCASGTAVLCSVSCPPDQQAIAGGVLDLTVNGFVAFDRPGEYVNRWEVLLESLDGLTAAATPYVVCLRK
jgi:hypothetical protein